MPTIGTIGVSPTVCSILLQKQQGLIGLTPDEVRIASSRVKLNTRTALVPFCGICKYYHGGGHVSFFKRGSMFNADVTICKQLRYTSCGRGKAKWRGTQFCQQSWSWSCAAFPFAGLPFNCLTIFLWFLEHSHTQSLIGSRLHLAKENAVAVDVAVDGCACRLSCQFIFYNNSHKYRHAQRNDSKSTKRQTERDRGRQAREL